MKEKLRKNKEEEGEREIEKGGGRMDTDGKGRKD